MYFETEYIMAVLVIQGADFGTSGNRVCNFLLAISCNRFRNIAGFLQKRGIAPVFHAKSGDLPLALALYYRSWSFDERKLYVYPCPGGLLQPDRLRAYL